jgi:hypothetical protein
MYVIENDEGQVLGGSSSLEAATSQTYELLDDLQVGALHVVESKHLLTVERTAEGTIRERRCGESLFGTSP